MTNRYKREYPSSLFIQENLKGLLDFPLKPFKLPSSITEKIELEPIPSLMEYFGPPSPIQTNFTKPGAKNTRFIIGYREIFAKRNHLKFLRMDFGLPPESDDDDCPEKLLEYMDRTASLYLRHVAPGGRNFLKKLFRNKKKHKPKPKGKLAAKSKSHATLRSKRSPAKLIAGKKSKKTKTKARALKGAARRKHLDQLRLRNARIRRLKALRKQDMMRHRRAKLKLLRHRLRNRLHQRHHQGNKNGHHLSKLAPGFGSHRHDKAKAREETVIVLDPTLIERPEIEVDFLRDSFKESEEEEGVDIKFVLVDDDVILDEDKQEENLYVGRDVGKAGEHDKEWLNLSDSDAKSEEAQEKAQAKLFYTERENWMLRGISYESQQFVKELRLYLLFATFGGRCQMSTKPNYPNRIIQFRVQGRKQFFFSITSVSLWVIFVLTLMAFLDTIVLSDYAYSSKHINEVTVYIIPVLLFVCNLTINAIWSIALLLNYGLRVAHYLNIWSISLIEMEVNAGRGLRKVVIVNLAITVAFMAVMAIFFVLNYPSTFKPAQGVMAYLALKNFLPDSNIKKTGPELQAYTSIVRYSGIFLNFYVMYSSRVTYATIHVLAVILRNATALWNLKFALKFDQVPLGNSGYLRHLKMRQTHEKIWLHHRLLTSLTSQLGYIFAIPVIFSYVCQLGVVIICLVLLFQAGYTNKYKRKQFQTELYNTTMINLPSLVEDSLTNLFVLFYTVCDFSANTLLLSAAGRSYRNGYEFVRRRGLILCKSTHEQRLIQSLEFSFSAAKAYDVNLGGFVSVNRESILSFTAIALLLWSLIIQLQSESEGIIVVYTPNCDVEPKGRNFEKYKDANNFCRKKFWLIESLVPIHVKLMENSFNYTTKLTTFDVRRKRSVDHTVVLHQHPVFSRYKSKNRYLANRYAHGNCLFPFPSRLTNSSTKPVHLKVEEYYTDFHEPCYSQTLNLTLIVPKLYNEDGEIWLGRKILDCGVFPFPALSIFNTDCAGNIYNPTLGYTRQHTNSTLQQNWILDPNIYDDCGWRKTEIDDLVLNNFKTGAKIEKLELDLPNGGKLRCWNIFTEIKRCLKIIQLNATKICTASSTVSNLNTPSILLQPYVLSNFT